MNQPSGFRVCRKNYHPLKLTVRPLKIGLCLWALKGKFIWINHWFSGTNCYFQGGKTIVIQISVKRSVAKSYPMSNQARQKSQVVPDVESATECLNASVKGLQYATHPEEKKTTSSREKLSLKFFREPGFVRPSIWFRKKGWQRW